MFLLQCCLLVDSLIPLSPLKLEIKIIKYCVIFSFYVFYMYGWLQKLINRHVFVFIIIFFFTKPNKNLSYYLCKTCTFSKNKIIPITLPNHHKLFGAYT